MHDAAACSGSGNAGGKGLSRLCKRFQAGIQAKDKRTVLGLVSVEVCVCGTQHLPEHRANGFCNQRFQQYRLHGHIDSHGRSNKPAFIACRQNDLIAFIHIAGFCDNLPGGALDLSQFHNFFTGNEMRTQPPCHFIVTHSGHQRIGVAISGAPAGTSNSI